MIVFRNLNPIEVNEEDGSLIIEIDASASGITDITSLQISTTDGTAVSTAFDDESGGLDFGAIAESTIIVNPADPETLNFTINLTDDAIAEAEENFQFQVTGTNDPSFSGTADIAIIDNDGIPDPDLEVEGLFPRISISDVEQLEGDSSNTNFEFTVNLSEASEEIVSVEYATADGTAETEDTLDVSTVNDAADYLPVSDILEFNPGETEKTITVEVLTDTISLESEAPEENFFINLANAVNADIDNNIATGTILDDDLENTVSNPQLPVISIEAATFSEPDLGEDTTEQLTVNLLDTNGEPLIATEDISFNYSTEDITAIANADYEFVESQVITIPQGQSNTTIPLTILGDDIIEADETLSVILSAVDLGLAQFEGGASELTIAATIEDNDGFEGENPDLNEDLNFDDIRDSNVFRFLNTATGIHFYTADGNERDFIKDNLDNFQQEDSSFASVNPENLDSAAEIYRFFNSTTGGHLYTTDENERDFIIDNLDNFVFEDVAFFAFETNVEDTIPVYRFYEPNLGVHFYTGNESERTFVEDNLDNYNFEGVAYYALPTANEPA